MRAQVLTLLLVSLTLAAGAGVYALWIAASNTFYVNTVATTDAQLHMSTNMVLGSLQAERHDSTVYLGSAGRMPGATALRERQQQTDRQVAAFNAMATDKTLEQVDPSDARWIKTLRQRLLNLSAIRQTVGTRSASRSDVERQFASLTDACIGVFASMTTDKNPNFGDYHQSLVAFQRAHEALSQEDAALSGALASGRLTGQEYDDFTQLVGAQRGLFAAAKADVNDPVIGTAYDRVATTPSFKTLRSYEDRIIQRGRSQQAPRLSLNAWNGVLVGVSSDLGKMEHSIYDALVSHAKPVVTGVVIQLGVAALAIALIFVVAVILSIKFGRKLILRMDDLRNTVSLLATEQLPQLMDRLRRGETVDLEKEAPPIYKGRDEIGQVAEAFYEVQKTAFGSAIQVAEQNAGTREVFVNLARRSQSLLQRQLSALDEMERRTSDPEELDRLFAIDHLATRMRRHSEDLIILSGSPPGRRWRQPVAMVDVIRGAIGEVENYGRVTTLSIQEAALTGRVVADVIHLLAELIENATSFSPPHVMVQVSGEWVTNGFVVEIEDRGLGMTEEDRAKYNKRLTQPPEFNLSDTRQLGLLVVARLAERNGIKVHLGESPYGGTTAVALLPKALLVAEGGQGTGESTRAVAHAPDRLPRQAIGTRVAGPVDASMTQVHGYPVTGQGNHGGTRGSQGQPPSSMPPRGPAGDGLDNGGWSTGRS